MRDINDFFEGESGMAGEFGHMLQVVPLEDAKRIAIDYANQSKWIPVTERQPDKEGFYLTLRKGINRNPFYSVSSHDGVQHPIDLTGWYNVTHWQELPSEPL